MEVEIASFLGSNSCEESDPAMEGLKAEHAKLKYQKMHLQRVSTEEIYDVFYHFFLLQ